MLSNLLCRTVLLVYPFPQRHGKIIMLYLVCNPIKFDHVKIAIFKFLYRPITYIISILLSQLLTMSAIAQDTYI